MKKTDGGNKKLGLRKSNDRKFFCIIVVISLFFSLGTTVYAAGFGLPSDPFEYKNDVKGTYPGHYAENEGGNVRNYDYGKKEDDLSNPSSTNVFGSSQSFDNGYLEYGQTENEGYYLKKWAEATSDPTKFNIFLDIIGKEEKKPVDIAIMLDKSNSMSFPIAGESVSKNKAMIDAVLKFTDTLLTDPNLDVQIAIGSFAEPGWSSQFTKEADAFHNSGTTWGSVLHSNPGAAAGGATYISSGMSAGLGSFDKTSARQGAKKFFIFLSDGAPTLWDSASGAMSSNNGADPLTGNGPLYNFEDFSSSPEFKIADNEPYPTQFGSMVGTGAYTGKTPCINTIAYSKKLLSQEQYKDINVFTIGFNIDSDTGNDKLARNTLKNIAGGEAGYFNSVSSTSLLNDLVEIAGQVQKSATDAHVVDPLGVDPSNPETQVFSLKQDSLKVKSFNVESNSLSFATDPPAGVVFKPNGDNTEVETTGITLGKGEGIRLSYQVERREAFKNGLFYPVNGDTYLENKEGDTYNPETRSYFAVPAVKVADESEPEKESSSESESKEESSDENDPGKGQSTSEVPNTTEKTSQNNPDQNGTSVQTGDDADMSLYAGLAILALLVIGGLKALESRTGGKR